MEARDRRAQRQRELLAEYGQTLLCFTLNIPGPEKESPLIRQGFRLGQRRLHQGFLRLGIQPVHHEEELRFTGCEAFYVLPAAPIDVKRMAADIEQANAVGRLFDMDVLRPDGSKVERQEIGLPERTCLICGKEAVEAVPHDHPGQEIRQDHHHLHESGEEFAVKLREEDRQQHRNDNLKNNENPIVEQGIEQDPRHLGGAEQEGEVIESRPGTVHKQIRKEGFPGLWRKVLEGKEDAEERQIAEKNIPDYRREGHEE